MDEVTQIIEDEIEELLSGEMQKDWKEYEQYRDNLFSIANIAEEGGFEKGFQFAIELLMECISGGYDFNAKP